MTEKEAINYYEKAMQIHKDEFGDDQKAVDLYNTTINALRELQQYRAIGTIKECREARKKQIKKKPVKDEYNHDCCPNCGWIVYQDEYGGRYLPHCENCGQAIDWSDIPGQTRKGGNGRSNGMDNIKVTIIYCDGKVEACYVSDYGVKNGCLSLYQRYKGTSYIPIDRIKEWKVSN